MGLGRFLRSLAPGDDQQLAEDLSKQRRAAYRRNVTKTAREGQAWEDQDRARDRQGDRHTEWDN
ncbi:hypothetical protein ACIQAC_01350 [Streptomyces sp. NPDC088387]|uniref:hypothetical protein n=1 Tax=Streptomyces sp. NPDC088387 TaxID=3365859 RepID=UPI00381192B2